MQASNDLASAEHKTPQIEPRRRKRGKKTHLGRTKKRRHERERLKSSTKERRKRNDAINSKLNHTPVRAFEAGGRDLVLTERTNDSCAKRPPQPKRQTRAKMLQEEAYQTE